MIVAVNKIDKEGADPTRVRTEMTARGLQPVEWGGEVEFCDVSAKTKQGLEDLLDTIQLWPSSRSSRPTRASRPPAP